MPQEVSSLGDLNKIKVSSKGKLIVMDFYATWCGPCRMISPKVDEMEKEFGNVVFIKVNVDDAEDITEKYKISVMPTFVFERDGQIVEQIQGANDVKLRAAIQKHSSS